MERLTAHAFDAAHAFTKRQSNTQTSDPKETSSSATQLLSTLAPVALVAAIFFILFIILRRIFPRKYEPRTFLDSLDEYERSPQLGKGLFGWVGVFFKIPDSYVLNHHSLDAYLYLRFFKVAIVTCLVGCLITWPVLFPINITGGGGLTQLDMLTFGNVTDNRFKYFAHVGCMWLFFGFVMYMIARESIFYINLRQAYLMSPLYTSRMSSRTVLFVSVPDDYLNEIKLREMLGPQVKSIWFPTDTKDLEDIVDQRDKALWRLEAAEVKLVKQANAARLKSAKKGGASAGHHNDDGGESGSVAAQYLSKKQRPTHKTKPIIGKKVDTIDWCRSELQHLIPKVAAEQDKHRRGECKLLHSVFVEFTSVTEAQAAYQSLTHHQVLHMAPRYTGLTPGEVIWSNLNMGWLMRLIRKAIATAFIVALVTWWSIPVAFIGALSNIKALSANPALSWLSWLADLPSPVVGLISGLLPTILLAVLMALLPIILRKTAKVAGAVTLSQVELTTQNYYFAFQVIQVFLVATLGSAAAATYSAISKNPSSATSLLAKSIPKASNFYLAYFILQGLGVVAAQLVGIVGLLLFYVLGKLLDNTPRKMYKRWSTLAGVGWGTLYPIYTNLFVIALCYSVIAPLVLIFAAIGLWLFYFAFRYNLLFVFNAQIDCKGRNYPRALQHVFTGMYIAEICMIGLIGTSVSDVKAIGPLLLMILLVVFTVLFHMNLNAALTPLIEYMPKSIAAEERRLTAAETGGKENGISTAHAGDAPHKKPNMLTKFLKPHVYCDYATMRRLVPRELTNSLVHDRYTEQIERDAYFNPSITAGVPLLWIPRDEMGVSRQEVRDSGKVVPITDVGAHLNEKNKIVWDDKNARPPIYEETIYY